MRFIIASATVTGLASLASAMPAATSSSFYAEGVVFKRDGPGTEPKKVVDLIKEIAPASVTCDVASLKEECATADEAAPFLINAMVAYKIYTPSAIAAVLALISFESGELRFNRNHDPGRPGQGTRNMQNIAFNLQYAKSKPELADKLPAGDENSFTDDQKNDVLALVMPNQYSFETAPWFLANVCTPDVLEKFKTDVEAAWSEYMSCVGVSATDEGRLNYWKASQTAFGIQN